MTIASATNRVSYSGNGSTTAFAFAYPFRATSDLVVTVRTTSTGAESLQTEGTHYTVTGTPTTDAGGYASGTVTFVTAPASGTQIHIDREPARTQTTDYIAGDGIPPSSIEGSLDRLTLLVQDLESRLARTLMQPRTAANRSLTLPEPSSSTVNRYLGVNAAGTLYELKSSAPAANVLSVADYGAIGNGVADDSAAFQAAYNAASANSIIYIPPGSYYILTPVSGSKYVHWWGHGALNAAGSGPLQVTMGHLEGHYGRRKLFRQTSTASTDYTTVEVQRVTSHSGGTAGVVASAHRAYTSVLDGITNYEWTQLAVLDNYASAGENVASYAQANKYSGAGGSTWAHVAEARDRVAAANPAFTLVAQELDLFSNGTDSGSKRVGQDIVIGKHDSGGATCEASWGSRITPHNGTASEGRVKKGYSTEIEFDTAFDAHAGTQASGGAAFWMADSQAFKFDTGGARKWFYSGGVIVYQISGVTKFQISMANDANDGKISIQGSQVLGTRDTGWTAMTGTTNKATSYDTSTVTLAQLAGRVMAIQAALTTHGLLGT